MQPTKNEIEPVNFWVNFTYEGVAVRIVKIDGAFWFVLADVAKILGYGLATNAARLLRDHQKGIHKTNTLGGQQDMTIINEAGLYRLIMKSNQPNAERFQDWVCEDVLPTIRETGSYGKPLALPTPLEYAEMLVAAERMRAELEEQNVQLISLVQVTAEKADDYNDFIASDDDMLISDAAKELEIKPGKIHAWLSSADIKWIFERGLSVLTGKPCGPWTAYQHIIDKGWMKMREPEFRGKNGKYWERQPVITRSGLAQLKILKRSQDESRSKSVFYENYQSILAKITNRSADNSPAQNSFFN